MPCAVFLVVDVGDRVHGIHQLDVAKLDASSSGLLDDGVKKRLVALQAVMLQQPRLKAVNVLWSGAGSVTPKPRKALAGR